MFPTFGHVLGEGLAAVSSVTADIFGAKGKPAVCRESRRVASMGSGVGRRSDSACPRARRRMHVEMTDRVTSVDMTEDALTLDWVSRHRPGVKHGFARSPGGTCTCLGLRATSRSRRPVPGAGVEPRLHRLPRARRH